MLQIDAIEKKKQRKLLLLWCVTFLVVFPLLITLGLLMRLNQGEWVDLKIQTFYALMTLHGLGMAGILFSFSVGALTYLIATRYAKVSLAMGYFIYVVTLLGVIGLAIATLIGKFGAGWYILYPLPFKGTFWTAWSTGLAIVSLLILGIAWLLACISPIYALAKEYGGFLKLTGWQYLKKEKPERELPPIAMITVAALIPGVLAYLAGGVMLIEYLMQHLNPGLSFNPLMMKNLTFFFGHTLVNITMYVCVGWVYTLLPEFTGRPWKIDKITAIAWSLTFFCILFAYFHHLYMDFAQDTSLQYIGQIVSYLSAVPATAASLFGVIAQLYHSKIKWTMFPTLILFGCMGWAIGGFSAVVDSTIVVNEVFHNTLWVPAHFHSYLLMGVVLFIFGFLFYFGEAKENPQKDSKPKIGFWLLILGGWGFLLMFYLGGMNSIPRRFATYAGIKAGNVHHTGALLAEIAAVSIIVLLLGLLIMYIRLFAKLLKKGGWEDTVEPAIAK